MAKQTHTQKEKIALKLLLSAKEAEERLRDRINKGAVLRDIKIESLEALESAKREYRKWDDFNSELLKQMFTSEEIQNEYNQWAGAMLIYEQSGAEKVKEYRNGVMDKIHRIDSIIERLSIIPLENPGMLGISQPKLPNPTIDKSKVFIVHGHDELAKLEVARFIDKIGFTPIILHEQVSCSMTIIEKIESYSDVGFGVVIYSPCDVGAAKDEAANLMGRARQNVVFEHGFLIGKLKRENVCALKKGKVETPNDISGIVYESMDDASWSIKLAKELRAAGYPVDMNKVL